VGGIAYANVIVAVQCLGSARGEERIRIFLEGRGAGAVAADKGVVWYWPMALRVWWPDQLGKSACCGVSTRVLL